MRRVSDEFVDIFNQVKMDVVEEISEAQQRENFAGYASARRCGNAARSRLAQHRLSATTTQSNIMLPTVQHLELQAEVEYYGS